MQEAKRLLAEALRIDPDRINDNACMKDLRQWDSLAHMELIVLVEQKLGGMLSEDEILEMITIPGLANVIARNKGGVL